jgi:hypothetical protein
MTSLFICLKEKKGCIIFGFFLGEFFNANPDSRWNKQLNDHRNGIWRVISELKK